jgi:hypothetical protein
MDRATSVRLPVRRIGFAGGPCTGKSSIAPKVFAELKAQGRNVEYVGEWIKPHAYAGHKVEGFGQVYVFAKQLHEEERFLQHGVDVVVTECPLFQCVAYTRLQAAEANKDRPNIASDEFNWTWKHLAELAIEFEKAYPSFTYLLNREGIPYKPFGRYQDEAHIREVDRYILGTAEHCGLWHHEVSVKDFAAIMKGVEQVLAMKAEA